MQTLTETTDQAFKLKAGLFTLITCYLFDPDPLSIEQQLRPCAQQAPHFFQQQPIILDLSALKVPSKQNADLFSIIHCLRQYGLTPVGVRGGTPQIQKLAIQAGLSVLSNLRHETTNAKTAGEVLPPATTKKTKLITQPVRSGQQIYAKNSDLIIRTSVSPGAELLADGNIHIYGRLKGRALAGVNGNKNAHIFCSEIEAELVAIAGNYWLSEDLQNLLAEYKKGVHIFLQDKRLQLVKLT